MYMRMAASALPVPLNLQQQKHSKGTQLNNGSPAGGARPHNKHFPAYLKMMRLLSLNTKRRPCFLATLPSMPIHTMRLYVDDASRGTMVVTAHPGV
jgi:hypothetical protein